MTKKITISNHKDLEDYQQQNANKNKLKNIQYENCIFEYWSNMRKKKEDRISIYDCIFKVNVEVKDATIVNCIFEEDAILKSLTTHQDDSSTESKLQFNKNVEFKKSFLMFKQDKNKYHYAKISKKDLFPNLIFKSKALFKEIEFQEEFNLYLRGHNDGKVEFSQCKFNKKFKIRNFEYDKNRNDIHYNEQQTKAKLNSLKIIDCTASENAYLRIGFLEVGEFELKNLRNPQNAELNIGDCHFKNFKLSNFRNIGKFKLFKINTLNYKERLSGFFNKLLFKEKATFQIDNTSIGDADFQSVNLSSFSTVKMFDNILVGLKYTNIKWGEFGNKKEIEVGQFQGNETFKLEKQQDTYRTLKNVASSNNDQPQAIQFYAKEMENHYALVPRSDFSTKITLWFNKWSNGFGLHWGWQLLFLIAFASVMYCFLLLSIDIDYHQLKNCESEDNILGNFVNFINPIHSTEFIFKDSWNNLTYTIDFIFRIIEGLMLYQIIQAFRKYTRKL